MNSSAAPLGRSDLTAIILAAGLSSRAAPDHKLLRPAAGGRPVIAATVAAFTTIGFREVLVVVGHARERIEAALAGQPVRFVLCADFAAGMGHSLAAGIAATAASTRGFVVSPGDLPELTPEIVTCVTDRFLALRGERHLLPVAKGQRGHPVVLAAALREPLQQLHGDTGAKHLLATEAALGRVELLDVGSRAIWSDRDGRDRST